MSRLPQGDSAVLVFNEEAGMMDILGGGFSDVRFESIQNDDQVVRIIRQGDQVLRFLYCLDFTTLTYLLNAKKSSCRRH